MNSSYSGHVANIHLTVNGQSLEVSLNAIAGHIEGWQVSDYNNRSGITVGKSGYGGYESERIHMASTRTIANMIERYIKENY